MEALTEEKLRLIFNRFEVHSKMGYDSFVAAIRHIEKLNKLDIETNVIMDSTAYSKISEIETELIENPKTRYTIFDLKQETDKFLYHK